MTTPSPVWIAVCSSPIHGQGAHARRRLPQGTCIGVYEGRRYSAEAFLTVDWILPGEGLFLDYALAIDERETPADYPCRCALPGWRGAMAAV